MKKSQVVFKLTYLLFLVVTSILFYFFHSMFPFVDDSVNDAFNTTNPEIVNSIDHTNLDKVYEVCEYNFDLRQEVCYNTTFNYIIYDKPVKNWFSSLLEAGMYFTPTIVLILFLVYFIVPSRF